jgi:hypothetical protein
MVSGTTFRIRKMPADGKDLLFNIMSVSWEANPSEMEIYHPITCLKQLRY